MVKHEFSEVLHAYRHVSQPKIDTAYTMDFLHKAV